MTTTLALTALVCLAAGGWIGWLVARTRAAESTAQLRADHARLAAALEHRDRVIPDQLTLLDGMQRQLRDSFEALAASALAASTEQFLSLADQKIGNVHRAAAADLTARQQALDALVAPIRDTLGQVAATLAETDRHRVHDAASLRTLLSAVGHTQQQLQQETQTLVRALRSPGVRGQWGEVQLRKVVELAGMLEHCDFDQQPTGLIDGAFRLTVEPGTVIGGFHMSEERTDLVVIWVARKHAADPQVAYEQLLTDVSSLTAGVVRDGAFGGGDYAVPDGTGVSIEHENGREFAVARLQFPVNYEVQL